MFCPASTWFSFLHRNLFLAPHENKFRHLIFCANSDLKKILRDKKIFHGNYDKHGVSKGKHSSFLHFGIVWPIKKNHPLNMYAKILTGQFKIFNI